MFSSSIVHVPHDRVLKQLQLQTRLFIFENVLYSRVSLQLLAGGQERLDAEMIFFWCVLNYCRNVIPRHQAECPTPTVSD